MIAVTGLYLSRLCPLIIFVASVIESLRHDRRMYTTIESITLRFNKDMQIVEKHLEIACNCLLQQQFEICETYEKNVIAVASL